MSDEPPGPGPWFRPFFGGTYHGGTGFTAVLWFVLALALGVVGFQTSGAISDVFLAGVALSAVFGAINLGYYVTGHRRGHWTYGPEDPDGDRPT
jgi:hypothetical protein